MYSMQVQDWCSIILVDNKFRILFFEPLIRMFTDKKPRGAFQISCPFKNSINSTKSLKLHVS